MWIYLARLVWWKVLILPTHLYLIDETLELIKKTIGEQGWKTVSTLDKEICKEAKEQSYSNTFEEVEGLEKNHKMNSMH